MASPFGQILLVTGNSEFEAERTRRRAVDAVVSAQPDVSLTGSSAAELAPGEFVGLTSPSLFSEVTAVVVTELEELPEPSQREVLEYAESPSPDVAVILVHGGGTKGKGLLDQLRRAAAVTEIKVQLPKYDRGYTDWVQREVRAGGAAVDQRAALGLVAAVGHDQRALAGAVSQLIAAAPTDAIDLDLVRQYFGGRAEVRGYDISDAALSGQLHTAMEVNRWAEAARTAPLVIIAAVAAGLRTLAKLDAAPPELRDADLASRIGAPPFKIRALRQQLAGWDAAGLARAIKTVADTDVAVKGGETEPGYAIERMLLDVASSRRL